MEDYDPSRARRAASAAVRCTAPALQRAEPFLVLSPGAGDWPPGAIAVQRPSRSGPQLQRLRSRRVQVSTWAPHRSQRSSRWDSGWERGDRRHL